MTRCLLACALVGLTSCHSGPSAAQVYSEAVFALTYEPQADGVERHLSALNAVVERSGARGERVPPGVHAHIGYLYARLGQLDTARAAFLTEKVEYPESTVFVDGVLARMNLED